MDNERYIFIVIVGTAFALSMIAIVGFLMIVNTNRRHRYRADLAEADLRREGEVMLAEREATEQTLNEIGRELHDNVGQLLTVA
ncbi:MAG: histidine kinase, partial [Flavobacteriales bacterium]|nr:histidine kinase [Flavobacteriales bacterium]